MDVVITPITGQGLPGFELVHGPSASADLVRRLKPRYVVPMCNGDVDARGASAPFIRQIGSRDDFERESGLEVLNVVPGEPISLSL